jgi:cytochrome c oxidase assembly protein Cox11
MPIPTPNSGESEQEFVAARVLRCVQEVDRLKSIAVVALVLAALLVVAALGLTYFAVPVHSVGTIKTVGVGAYWDRNCTQKASEIDWGTLEPGQNESVAVYVRNESSVHISLSLSTGNWTPSNASVFISLTWSWEGQFRKQGDVAKVTLVLMVSKEIKGVGAFSFDIVIAGSG